MLGSTLTVPVRPGILAERIVLARRRALLDQFPSALEQRRFRDNLVETGGVSAPQTSRVGVVREAEDRHVRKVVGDVVRIDPRDVRDHEIRWLDPVRRLKAMLGQERFELAADEEVDPAQEDRGHA